MHLENSYLGYMRKAESLRHRGHLSHEWLVPFMDDWGLILVFQSDSQPELRIVYMFGKGGRYMHTSKGQLRMNGRVMQIETVRSLYEFELNPKCVPANFLRVMIGTADQLVGEDLELDMLELMDARRYGDKTNEKYPRWDWSV